jgi:hypothetical protein
MYGLLAQQEGMNRTVVNTAKEKTKKPSLATGLDLESWRPHGESNPGYRRERAVF